MIYFYQNSITLFNKNKTSALPRRTGRSLSMKKAYDYLITIFLPFLMTRPLKPSLTCWPAML